MVFGFYCYVKETSCINIARCLHIPAHLSSAHDSHASAFVHVPEWFRTGEPSCRRCHHAHGKINVPEQLRLIMKTRLATDIVYGNIKIDYVVKHEVKINSSWHVEISTGN